MLGGGEGTEYLEVGRRESQRSSSKGDQPVGWEKTREAEQKQCIEEQ